MLVDETSTYGPERICEKVKLVIWDLDDTFWTGTLSEGPITTIPENIEAVKTLAARGIISAICSKNEYEAAREALVACDIWDYFVFNKIDFSPKSPRIAAIVEEMNLRPANVLFIDDNVVNLREVEFAVPGVMVAHPAAVLPSLLDNAFLTGKPDAELKRLNQYRQLQKKVVEQAQTTLSNEEFLRSCGIHVSFIYDVEPHVDRLIDLVNRSNQLNYTKKRIDESDRDGFIAHLRQRDVYAAAVSVSDRYGDYGIVGFFLQVKDPVAPQLEQFVFSCRIMNMGVEQYVYDHLGRPPFEVAPPVAYPVVLFDKVDWISEDGGATAAMDTATDDKLLLIGGCDLLQVASYCSRRRVEFVNDVRDNVTIRYDDFGFVLNDRDAVTNSRILPEIPCWTADEAVTLDAELAESDVLVISLWVALRGRYLVTRDQVAVRVHPHGLGYYLDDGHRKSLQNKVDIFKLSREQNAMLLKSTLLALVARSPRAHSRILLGANTRTIDPSVPQEDRDQRILYNEICEELARTHDGLEYVGIDDLIPVSQMVDEWHYSRMGYLTLAEAVKQRISAGSVQKAAPITAAAPSICDVVRQGRATSAFSLLGPDGYGAHPTKHAVRRMLKSSQIGRLALTAAKATLTKTGQFSKVRF
jgi:FkbH-like protein